MRDKKNVSKEKHTYIKHNYSLLYLKLYIECKPVSNTYIHIYNYIT